MFKKAKSVQKAAFVRGSMYQDCTIIQNDTMTEIMKLMKEKRHDEVLKLLSDQKDVLGTFHELYPDYTVEVRNIMGKDVFCSKPLTPYAHETLPQSIRGVFKLPKKYHNFSNLDEVIRHSYNSQEKIEINMIEMKKMIGNQLDPFQDELKLLGDLSKAQFFIEPNEFPKAKPYRIVITDSNESLDFILLRTVKIIEPNKVILSNAEQEYDIKVNLAFDLQQSKIDFSFDTNSTNKHILLKYLKFMLELRDKKELFVISLEENTPLCSGISSNINLNSPFDTIENEIDFLEKIILIEDFFKKDISIPSIIEPDDFHTINYLVKVIKKEELTGKWENFSFSLCLDNYNIDRLKNSEGFLNKIGFQSKETFSLFGVDLSPIEVMRTFDSCRISDFQKLKSKLNVLEKGDPLKIDFTPGDNNIFTDTISFL